jgi:hypothetical protein
MLPLQRQSGSAKKSSRPANVGPTYSASAGGPNLPPALSGARGSSSCTVDIGGLIDSRTEYESRIHMRRIPQAIVGGGALPNPACVRSRPGYPDRPCSRSSFEAAENQPRHRDRSTMMTDQTEVPTSIPRRTLARWSLGLHGIRLPILRYGFSVACVAIALGLALAFQHYGVQNVESPPFSLAIVLTA